MVSRDRLQELVAELMSDADASSEEGQWDLAGEIVDQVLAELQVEESEDES